MKYTDEQLIEALRELARRLGKTPTAPDARRSGNSPSRSSYIRRWGSWVAACRAAGLEPNHRGVPAVAKEVLIDELRALAAQVGHTPTQGEVLASKDTYCFSTYHHAFGSWRKACVAAGLTPNRSGVPVNKGFQTEETIS